MKAEFLTPLTGSWIDDDIFEVQSDLRYSSTLLNEQIFVPVGFQTDFASVPRVPIIYTIFGNRAHHESVIHDYCYRYAPNNMPRIVADKIFLESMESRGKSLFIRQGMYQGVRLGAWNVWRKYRKNQSNKK